MHGYMKTQVVAIADAFVYTDMPTGGRGDLVGALDPSMHFHAFAF